ncbi:MAG: replication initiator protein A [Eubacterium sp.]|nr:replication initiator protein A [Eubacterium sp.]
MMPLTLDYYYGNEAEQYSFYRIPKVLFTDRRFRGVSVEAKVLYGLLLDRMALSVKNGWLDGDGRVYIIFTVADVMETLACAEQKANKLLGELDAVKGIGLIERKRRGLGKPNVIYVKYFITGPQTPPEDRDKPEPSGEPGLPRQAASGKPPVPYQQVGTRCLVSQETTTLPRDRDTPKPSQQAASRKPSAVQYSLQNLSESQIQNCENHKSGNVKITIQELRKSQTNDTDLNDTEMSETDPSINPRARAGGTGRMDTMGKTDLFHAYRALIRENISYGILLERYPYDRERIDGFVELMAEICCSSRRTVRINQGEMGAEVVKSRFLELDSAHIEYVMDCLDRNTTLVGNIRAYTLSALFNAPVTISQYYASLVRHDMAAGFGGG